MFVVGPYTALQSKTITKFLLINVAKPDVCHGFTCRYWGKKKEEQQVFLFL